MDELEEIKKRKIIEMQRQQEEALKQQLAEEEALASQIEQLESVVKPFLDKEALGRYGNLKIAHGEKAVQLIVVLAQAIQQGAIKKMLSDSQLREILIKMEPEKKEFRIRMA